MTAARPGAADEALSLRERLVAGESLFATFVKTTSHQTVEVLAATGLDTLVLDAEHAPFGPESLDRSLLAARACSLPVLVRVPYPRGAAIQQALDMGAAGVMVPHVDSAAIALEVVRAARYGGTRGYSASPRAGGYGQRGMAEHLRLSDAHTAVLVQIESGEAVAQVREIAAVPGVDCLFIGPADLAVSIGPTARATRAWPRPSPRCAPQAAPRAAPWGASCPMSRRWQACVHWASLSSSWAPTRRCCAPRRGRPWRARLNPWRLKPRTASCAWHVACAILPNPRPREKHEYRSPFRAASAAHPSCDERALHLEPARAASAHRPGQIHAAPPAEHARIREIRAQRPARLWPIPPRSPWATSAAASTKSCALPKWQRR